MNNIIKMPLSQGRAAAVWSERPNLPDMNAAAQAGLQPSFASLLYKGKNFRIKYRGEAKLLLGGTGAPLPSIEVVIVGISDAISKLYYIKDYEEGDMGAPDCFSVDGVQPDAASPHKQCTTCAACPQNVWGSKTNSNKKKIKACQDGRRIAIVPTGDPENATYGGPMLLKIPPMSLANLSRYTNELARFGAQPFMVSTTLSFDYEVASPRLTFTASRWLAEEEASAIEDALDNPLIDRMLHVEAHEVTHDPEGEADHPLQGGQPAGILTQHARAVTAKAQGVSAAFEQSIPSPPPPPPPQPSPPPPPPAAKSAAPKFPPINKPAAAAAKPSPFETAAPVAAAQKPVQPPEGHDELPPSVQAIPVTPDDLEITIDSMLNS